MKYEEIVTKLNEHSETHPNIVSLWKHYIHIKRESYQNSIQNCLKAIDAFKEQSDIEMETILLFYTLHLISNE